MRGRIERGDLITLAPVNAPQVRVDDVVLVRWKSNYLPHLVREIRDGELLIENNLATIDGWGPAIAGCGRVIDVVLAAPAGHITAL